MLIGPESHFAVTILLHTLDFMSIDVQGGVFIKTGCKSGTSISLRDIHIKVFDMYFSEKNLDFI